MTRSLHGAAGSMARLVFVFALFLAVSAGLPARAMDIQEVRSPGGIEAWLVEDHSIPIISLRFGLVGGTSQDPADRLGLVNMLTGLLDEGAGDLDSHAFQRRLQDLNVKMSFDAGRDNFTGVFQTLSKNRDNAFELLRLALTEARFDQAPIDRIRRQLQVNLKRKSQDPNSVASRAWMKLAFGEHPYGNPSDGTVESLASVTSEDLKAIAAKLFTRGGLKIAVVGDIDAKTLSGLLDKTFGAWPKDLRTTPVAEASIAPGPIQKTIDMNIPQSVIQFGHLGFKRDDKDFIPAYLLNHILGGGGFGSRLTTEVREKRGLTYSVYSYLSPLDRGGLFMGGAATKNDRVAESLAIIRSELERMATGGPTEEELKNAKTYLTGSYALRFDSSSKIAGQLLGIQMENLGIDYPAKRNGLVEAVTIEDIKRVAGRLLKPGSLIVTIVGRPEGV